jgi:hypothetical protein
MNKNTPLARAVRTFVMTLAASAVAWVGIDWTTSWRPGATVIALNVVAAVIAGLISLLMALQGKIVATTAWGKALVTFCQVLAAGLGTLYLNELTTSGIAAFGHAVFTDVTAAISAAVISFLTNSAEDHPPAGALGTPAT